MGLDVPNIHLTRTEALRACSVHEPSTRIHPKALSATGLLRGRPHLFFECRQTFSLLLSRFSLCLQSPTARDLALGTADLVKRAINVSSFTKVRSSLGIYFAPARQQQSTRLKRVARQQHLDFVVSLLPRSTSVHITRLKSTAKAQLAKRLV